MQPGWVREKARHKKMRPRSDAATDGDRFGRLIRDGGPDQTQAKPNPALLRRRDSRNYPQAGNGPVPDAVPSSDANDGPRISSAPHHKGGALRSIRGTVDHNGLR
jgi:hypothetical protein